MAPAKAPARGSGGAGGSHARTVDLVTGKAKVEYFFDPSLVVPPDADPFDPPARTNSSSSAGGGGGGGGLAADDASLLSSRHLFV
ncbi:hypothetical protein ACHAWF_011493, partial [Thalassiosira exigua]